MIELRQFCAVLAATEEGFDEEAVLAVEGVSVDDFAAACATWLPQLAADESEQATSDALATLKEERLATQERHRRTVAPIESDLEAWVAFLVAFENGEVALSADPSGITAADLARLSRDWEARLTDDSAEAERAAALREQLQQEASKGEALHIEVEPHLPLPSDYAADAVADSSTKPEDGIANTAQDDPSDAGTKSALLLPLDVLAELDAWVAAGRLPVDWLHDRKGLLAALAGLTEGEMSERWLAEAVDQTRQRLDTDAQWQQDYRLFRERADDALERAEQTSVAEPISQEPSSVAFAPLQIASPITQSSVAPPRAAPEALDQTLGLEGRVLRLDPLPFVPPDPNVRQGALAPSGFVRDAHNLDGTVGLDPQANSDDADPLPFVSGEGRVPERIGRKAPGPSPSAAHAIDVTSEVHLDQMVAGIQRLPASARRLPMTVEDYAYLVAITEAAAPAATGDPRVQAHARVGIGDEVARVAVDAIFAQHFRENTDVYAVFWELLGRWRLQMKG